MRLPILLLPVYALALVSSESAHGGENVAIQPIKVDLVQNDASGDVIRTRRQVAKVGQKWTGNTVYYYFDTTINDRKKKSVRAAAADLQSKTCVNFVENANAQNRIKIYSGQGCTSDTGMLGGEQQISLGDGCESVGAATKQFVHVLGLGPTHLQSSRDAYITIDPSAATKLPEEDSLIYTRYEYGSIMHASASVDTNSTKATLVPTDKRYLHTLGSEFVSFYDIQAINNMYGCSGVPKCKNNGVPSGNDGRVCDCPDGYGGPLCDKKPGNCGQTLQATAAWKTQVLQVGNSNRPNFIRQGFTKCTTWITAPAGKRIEVKINKIESTECNYGCTMGGIEIKGSSDAAVTNPRYCCREFVGTVVKSVRNPTPVIFYSRKGASKFTIAYHYVREPEEE